MTAEGATASSPEELVVSVEQANALIDLIGIREGHNALSSVIPVSGLMSAGLAGSTGLTGDAEAILGPARTVDSRLAIRVVSPRPSIGVRNVRIWPSRPRSVIMRAEDDGVHFTQVDDCDVPRILAEETLLKPGPTIHDGPPWISADFVQAVRDVDLERAQSAVIDVMWPPKAPVTLTFRRTAGICAGASCCACGKSGLGTGGRMLGTSNASSPITCTRKSTRPSILARSPSCGSGTRPPWTPRRARRCGGS